MKTVEDFLQTLSAEERYFVHYVHDAIGDKRLEAYILLDGEIVKTDMIVAALWATHHDNERIVGKDQVRDLEISTVFLTSPHRCGQFETMIFTPNDSTTATRYKTLDEAKKGHANLVKYHQG